MEDLNEAGAVVLANACGPCIGQWQRNIKKGETNTIVNSFNRNFRGRNDANANTLSFIGSPEVVMALGLSGRLDFNPETDPLEKDGKKFSLTPPSAEELPSKGFLVDYEGYQKPKGSQIKISIRENSERIQPLKPFASWDGKDLQGLLVLCKARGKCTTDHNSPAGYWLKYRGHLDKISDNLLLGAVNDFTGETGRGLNQFTNKVMGFSELARDYKSRGVDWLIVGDENYGEGSSREHAAMTPRYLGARTVVVKSFARIHETNLKKQGVLPLTFVNPSDYDKIQEKERIFINGLSDLLPGSRHILKVIHEDESTEEIPVEHSLNSEQIKWFKAGSSLNRLRQLSS